MMMKEVASSKNMPNSRLERKNHTQFEIKMFKFDQSISDQKVLKKHTLWSWTYLYSRYTRVPRPLWQSQREVSQVSVLTVITDTSVDNLYTSPGRKTPDSGNWADQYSAKWRISTNTPHPGTSHAQDLKSPAFLRLWISCRKRNTISFCEIASCWIWGWGSGLQQNKDQSREGPFVREKSNTFTSQAYILCEEKVKHEENHKLASKPSPDLKNFKNWGRRKLLKQHDLLSFVAASCLSAILKISDHSHFSKLWKRPEVLTELIFFVWILSQENLVSV